MAKLGSLERAVMDTLWDKSASAASETFTAHDVAATLPSHAYTTVLTVLDRLTRKGLIERIRDGKAHHYRPTGSRDSYVAELMHEALDATLDREAALIRFARTISPEQALILRRVLQQHQPTDAEGSKS